MKTLRILLLEDSPTDAELIMATLTAADLRCHLQRMETEEDFLSALISLRPDIVLADYTVPGFDGMRALEIRNKRAPDIPFIFVSGSLGEERAIASLLAGASDYILKDRMSRLPAAITRALQEKQDRDEKACIAAELEAERKLMRTLQDTTRALNILLDAEGRVLHMNPEAERVLDIPSEALLHSVFWSRCMAADDVKTMRHQIRMTQKNPRLARQAWRGRTHNQRSVMWSVSCVNTGHSGSRVVLCGIDITEQQAAEEKAYFLDNFDSLTGLPNRRLFLQMLSHRTSQPAADQAFALVLIGIPRLHDIHDSCGEAAMNLMMTALVQRLRQTQDRCQDLSRISENTFALLLPLQDNNELSHFVQELLEQLYRPVELEGRHFVTRACAGTALWPRDAGEHLQLLQAAESALHRAEHSGEAHAVYRSVISEEVRRRLQLEADLRRGLHAGNELVLHYQPQVDIQNGRVVGLEALVRWLHPQHGLLMPEKFMGIAETSGLMQELGHQVLRLACGQLQQWQQQGLAVPKMAVNVSASQFSSPDLLGDVQRALEDFGLAGDMLEVELTESTTMNDPQNNVQIMNRLQQLDVSLSIDDFGTGYSNFGYLKRFPVDRLKLDQTFVREITVDADDLAIARSIIAMAQQLHLEIIAEGVETLEQMQLLAAAGCRLVQGYYFSPPVPAATVRTFLERPFPVPVLSPHSFARTALS